MKHTLYSLKFAFLLSGLPLSTMNCYNGYYEHPEKKRPLSISAYYEEKAKEHSHEIEGGLCLMLSRLNANSPTHKCTEDIKEDQRMPVDE